MERECDFDRLRQWLLDYVPISGIYYPQFLERLDAAFPVTPAPASNKCDCDTFDGAHPQSWCDKPAPTPEIPEAVYAKALDAHNDDPVCSISSLSRSERRAITAAIAAYREHLRERPGIGDAEIVRAYYAGLNDNTTHGPNIDGLRAVAEAVKARLLGDTP